MGKGILDYWKKGVDTVGNALDSVPLIGGEGGLLDSFEGGSEAEAAAEQGRIANEQLEGLRDMIPGQTRTTRRGVGYAFTPGMERALDEAGAGVDVSERGAMDVDYEEIDPALYSDPQAIGVSGMLGGYDPSLINDATFDAMGVGDDRERYGQIQRDAVDRVFGIANEGGLSAIDRARIAEQRAGEEQWLRGQREATLANMEARGLSGGGTELASVLSGEQSSANRNALRGVQIEALAQQRQDQALRDAFGMSGDVRAEQNSLAQWNSQMTTDAARHRADVRNQGAFSDVNDQRGVRDYTTRRQDDTVRANTNTRNAERDATRNEAWNFYNANAGITGTQAGQAYGMQGNLMQQSAADSGRLIQGAGAAIGAAAGGPAGAQAGSQFGQQPTYQQYQAPSVQSQYRPPSEDDLIDPWET